MTHYDHDYVIETSAHRNDGLRHIKKEENIFEKISHEYGCALSDRKVDDVLVCSQSSAVSVCNNQSAHTTVTSLNLKVSNQKIIANRKKSKKGNSKNEITQPCPLTMLIRNSKNVLKLFAENGEKDVKKVVSAILKSQMDPETATMFSSSDITPEEFIKFLKSYKLTIKPLLAPENQNSKNEKSKKKPNSTAKWRYAANKTKPNKFKWHHTNFKEKPSKPSKPTTPVPPYATPLAQAYVELAARDRATAETLQRSSSPFNRVTRNDPCLPSATETEEADCFPNVSSFQSDPLDDLMEITSSESFNRDLCVDNSLSLWSDDSCFMDFEVNRSRDFVDCSRPIIESTKESFRAFPLKSNGKEQVEDVGEKTEKGVTMLNSSSYTNQQFPPSTLPSDFDLYISDDFTTDLINDASNCIDTFIETDPFPFPGTITDEYGKPWFPFAQATSVSDSHKPFEGCVSPTDSGIASPGSTGDFNLLTDHDPLGYPPSVFFPFPSDNPFPSPGSFPSPTTPEPSDYDDGYVYIDPPRYDEPLLIDRNPPQELTPLEEVPPQTPIPVTPPPTTRDLPSKPPSPKKKKNVHLWVFIRDLLLDPKHCPSLIKWEDRETGLFRFVQSEAVAAMWGEHKQNSNMTYEKLSRAMRYYYQRLILERVDGRRLVYKFGPKSYGWQLNSKPETSPENSRSDSAPTPPTPPTPPAPVETQMANSTSPSWFNDQKTEFEWPTEAMDSTPDFFNHSTLMPISTLLNPAKRVTTA